MGDFLQRFNHYGYDKEIYDQCRGLIIRSNESHARIITLWFALINAFYYMSASFGMFNVDPSRQGFFFFFTITGFLLMGLVILGGRLNPLFCSFCTVLDLVVFEVYSILSSNAEPYTTCWIFLILMVIVALSFVETMGFMSLILLVMSVIFCRMSYLNKPRSIASMDLANTVVVVSLALVLHFAFQRSRINEFAATIRDIKTQRKLEISSSFDPLTSLLNRGRFFSMADQLLKSRQENRQESRQENRQESGQGSGQENRQGNELLALMLVDLDEFKQINDNQGHQTGDLALSLTAKSIQDSLKIDLTDPWEFPDRALREGTSFAGRLGGDEFIVLLQGFDNREEMLKAASDIQEAVHHVEAEGIHGLRASIGITMISEQETNLDEAYKRADEALYVSKENGRDQINVNQF